MMQPLLGSFLRQLRRARRLSQAQAAGSAGIGRVTLNRWETGAQQPRAVELESLLAALSASAQEHQQALSLLDTPQARVQIRDILVQTGEQREIGPMPHRGDLLRALRMRRGFSQEEAAQRIGVTVRTLGRWERSEVWPSPSHLQTLCYVLQAHAEEMLALTTGQLPPLPDAKGASLDELRARGHVLHFYTLYWQGEALKELCFLLLEAQAWSIVARSGVGHQVLADLYTYHASHLSYFNRFAESAAYAERSLALLPKKLPLTPARAMAGITSAHAAANRGRQPVPQRGIKILRHWIDEVSWPDYRAWMLSNMADYCTQDGDVEGGLRMARRATEIAARCENSHELYNRELDEARLLIGAGKPGPALGLIQRDRARPYLDQPAKFQLLEAEAFLDLGELSQAHDRLQNALRLIEVGALAHLRRRARELALRF